MATRATGKSRAKSKPGSRASAGRKTSTRRYGDKASEEVEQAMRERKRGTLRSSSGQKVTSRKQAVAIGLSKARRAGGKVPRKRDSR